MTTTRGVTVVGTAALSCVLSWVLLSTALDLGWTLPAPPWSVVGVVALLAVGVLASAWPIRQWNAGNRDRAIDPLRAARTVVLAKAASLTGAVVTGLWGGFALVALPRLDVEAQSERALASGLAVLVSVGLTVAGLVAERWCRIPPDGEERDGAQAPNGSTA